MTGRERGTRPREERLGHELIIKLCGDMSDQRAAAIADTGATLAELERALAWAAGESDVMGEARAPLEGNAARIYDILVTDDETWAEGER